MGLVAIGGPCAGNIGVGCSVGGPTGWVDVLGCGLVTDGWPTAGGEGASEQRVLPFVQPGLVGGGQWHLNEQWTGGEMRRGKDDDDDVPNPSSHPIPYPHCPQNTHHSTAIARSSLPECIKRRL